MIVYSTPCSILLGNTSSTKFGIATEGLSMCLSVVLSGINDSIGILGSVVSISNSIISDLVLSVSLSAISTSKVYLRLAES